MGGGGGEERMAENLEQFSLMEEEASLKTLPNVVYRSKICMCVGVACE